MLKKVLGIMLSVMVIGGAVNITNTSVNMDKQQKIELAELGSGDIDPVLKMIESNQEDTFSRA